MNHLKKCAFLSVALVGFGSWKSPAHGEFLTSLSVNVSQSADSRFHYLYTLTNQAASDLNAFSFILDVSPDAALESVTGPLGWDITYAVGDSVIAWDSASSATDLSPGTSGLFGFSSRLEPTPQDFIVLGADTSGVSFDANQGVTSAPGIGTVPEPSSFLLFVLGILGLFRCPRLRTRSPLHRD
jgi:hypothetical protein